MHVALLLSVPCPPSLELFFGMQPNVVIQPKASALLPDPLTDDDRTQLLHYLKWCIFTVVFTGGMALARALLLAHFRWLEILPLAWPILLLAILRWSSKARPHAKMAICISHIAFMAFTVWNMDSTLALLNQQAADDLDAFLSQAKCNCTSDGVLETLPARGGMAIMVFLPYHCATVMHTALTISLGVYWVAVMYLSHVLMYSLTPVISAQSYAPLPLVITIAVCAGASVMLAATDCQQIMDLTLKLRVAHAREAAEAAKSQKADSVLNHILKNNMADASGCIDLVLSGQSRELLVKAQDILFRFGRFGLYMVCAGLEGLCSVGLSSRCESEGGGGRKARPYFFHWYWFRTGFGGGGDGGDAD